MPLLITDDKILLTVNYLRFPFLMATIVFCQIGVYKETRRHVKQIAAQQVSVEAREKFLKERKAFKVNNYCAFYTVIVLFSINYCSNTA